MGLSLFEASLFICTAIFGVGVVSLPSAFKSLGCIFGVGAYCFVGILTLFTIFLISSTLKTVKRTDYTYNDLFSIKYPYLGNILDYIIVLGGILSCMMYTEHLVKWFNTLFEGLIPTHNTFSAAIILFPLFFLSSKKEYKNLRYISYISVFSVFLFAFFILYYFFKLKDKLQVNIKLYNYDFDSGISRFILSMGCQKSIINIYNAMNKPSVRYISYASIISIIFVTCIYTTIGLCGYICFGDRCDDTIITLFCNKNFYKNNLIERTTFNLIAPKILIFSFFISLCGSYCFQIYPTRIALFSIFKRNFNFQNENVLRISTSLGVCIFNFICIMFNLDLKLLITLSGGTIATILCYTMPTLLYLTVNRKNIVITALATIVCILSFAFILKILIHTIKSL
ncbi:Transmembrane amino acid transporter protein [Spraguea lophii 42_110]|uniref:Transmembrane amino acid transporter protein n=1 Tax=Spraguea lophii (strain 42_110) TaxID=1358809 RepID=S7W8E7_SPRLO|nr:Transmembrane amino acid transporter protein [Spraguea lophii 42_110]